MTRDQPSGRVDVIGDQRIDNLGSSGFEVIVLRQGDLQRGRFDLGIVEDLHGGRVGLREDGRHATKPPEGGSPLVSA